MNSSLPWWRTDVYDDDQPIVSHLADLAGPKDVALVQAFPDGRTQGGWGLEPTEKYGRFMDNYMADKFNPRRALHRFNKNGDAFAIVMASIPVLCVDIDGKNGGLVHAKKLGALPATLSETSKSGDGFHLFYRVDDVWDEDNGFAGVRDRIGIEQGVDIRGTGCVFHYPQQRWNARGIAKAPDYLVDMLVSKQLERSRRAATIRKTVEDGDPLEVLIMHDQLLLDLAKPIPAGKRNNTLFAIGMQLAEAGVADWDTKVRDRASQVGLPDTESDKLITNITRQAKL